MSRSRATIAAVLGCALLLICGCDDPLDSRYGVTSPGSINGCAVLHEVFKGRTDLRDWRRTATCSSMSPAPRPCPTLMPAPGWRAGSWQRTGDRRC